MTTQPKIPVDLIVSRLAEDAGRAQDRVLKAKDVLLGPLETDISTTPYEVVFQVDRVKLKYYESTAEEKIKTPLLMVYALINRETMLDLQPGRSVVQNLLREGTDIYMIDWGYPTRKDQFLGIDDHVNMYMDDVVDFIRRTHNLSKINLMGICMGGVFSIIYSALHPDKIQNLVTTVTPTNFDTDKGLLHLWAREMDPDRIADTFGNLSGDVLNLVFLLLNPARLMIDKYVGFLENIDDRKFVENFVRMEKWIFDSPDVPGETFRQFIKDCYHKNLLIQNKMEVGGQRVDLKNITMPLLNIYGKYDHLVPPEACELLTKHVGTQDTEDIRLDTGHIGIYVSGKCQRELSPKIAQWLKDREAPEDYKPVEKAEAKKRTAQKAQKKTTPRASSKKKTKTNGSQA
jgi:polyhydroxyalkanoate synthase